MGQSLKRTLSELARGKISVEDAEKLIKLTSIEEIENMARIDVGREGRKGIPEVILAEGKRDSDITKIVSRLLPNEGKVIISRASGQTARVLSKALGSTASIKFKEKSRLIVVKKKGFVSIKTGGKVGVITAGTSDIPCAEEAATMAKEMGCKVFTAYDVGVAGIHRLFPHLKHMISRNVDAIVVAAGREGALPSVVTGMIDIPVIGLPTSTGYGLGKGGMAALMSMLQSCSLGMAVVNIDNGVAAGTLAAMIANKAKANRKTV